MPVTGFGAVGAGPSYSGSGYIFSDGIPMPIGRQMANGSQAAQVVWVAAFVSGRGAPRAGRIQIGPLQTDPFTVGAATTAQSTGIRPLSGFLAAGGTTRVVLLFTGQVFFGYGGGVGQVSDNAGLVRSGTLGGSYGWAQAPAAPTIATVTPSTDGTSVFFQYNGSGDQGDAAVNGYLVQRARDVGFTQDVQSFLYPVAIAGTHTIAGLAPGVTYFWRVTARNQVTDAASSPGGPWSGVIARVQPDDQKIGMIYNGVAWVPADARQSASTSLGWNRYLDGRIFHNGTWQPLG